MNIKENETVTLSLQTYKDMENELEILKKQVREKTIIKYYMHPIYGKIFFVIILMVIMLLSIYGKI